MPRHDARAHGVGCQRDVGLGTQGVGVDRGAVADGVDVGVARLLVGVHTVGPLGAELQVVAAEPHVGHEADRIDDEVGGVGALLGGDGAHVAGIVAAVGGHGLAEMALDAALGKALVHEAGELGVVVAGERSGRDVEDAHLLAAAPGGLGDLHADVAGADDGNGAHGLVGDLTVHLLALLEELEEADAVEVGAGKPGRDGQRPRGEDQLVIGHLEGGAVGRRASHQVPVEVDSGDARLHVDLRALGDEGLLVGVEELLVRVDLAADPQRGAAPEVAQVGVAVNHGDARVRIVVEQGVCRGDSGVVGPDDDDVHDSPLSAGA